MSNPVFIYGLIDPRTWCIRYVGWAADTAYRYQVHVNESKQGKKLYKCSWIRQLLSVNLLPLLVILDEIPAEDWRLCESAWIVYGLEQGWPLTNMTLGGDGVLGLKHTEESLNKMKESKRYISEETIQKMRESHKGHIVSEETKKKIGDGNRGKIISQEHHNKIVSSRNKLIKKSAVIIKIRELYDYFGMRVKDISDNLATPYAFTWKIVKRKRWSHIK